MAQPPVSAIEHYNRLLASHYTWMSGPYAARVAQQLAVFTQLGIVPTSAGEATAEASGEATAEAVDLGCGSGFQSIALAQLGFSVTAIDANAQLLAELDEHRGDLRIRTAQHDLCALATCSALPAQARVAVCMGDTLTHLPSPQAVATLFSDAARMLGPEGKFVLSFRDLSQEVYGLDRFIPVRSDESRIMTCFLEYERDTVIVHDLIYMRQSNPGMPQSNPGTLQSSPGEGTPSAVPAWTLHKSAYRKLRLSHAWAVEHLAAAGFQIQSQVQPQAQNSGLWTIVAAKARRS